MGELSVLTVVFIIIKDDLKGVKTFVFEFISYLF